MADAQGLGSPSPHLDEQDLYIKIRRACFGTWERPGDFLLLFDFSLGSGGPRRLQRNATHLHPTRHLLMVGSPTLRREFCVGGTSQRAFDSLL